MFKYTFFFVIRCFASDTVPEVARCSGPKSARRDLPGRSEPFCPFRRVLRSALVPRGPLQPVFLLSSSGLQRLPEEAGPVAFPRMPRFRPVSEPEAAGMSSYAVRSACVPIGLQPKVRAFAGEGFGYCRAKILLFR